MDVNFIKRATGVGSFNFNINDFKTDKYKTEIQHLYQNHVFKSFNPRDVLTRLDKQEYNRLVTKLKRDSRDQYMKLHQLPLQGVGPGEAALFLLTKTGVVLGGAGVDIRIDSVNYEVKACKYVPDTNNTMVHDFKVGGTVSGLTNLITDITKYMYDIKIITSATQRNISGSLFKQFKIKDPEGYHKFEKQYQKLVFNQYFGNKQLIFIQNNNAASRTDFGEIIKIGTVKQDEVTIDRITQGTIKPIVRI